MTGFFIATLKFIKRKNKQGKLIVGYKVYPKCIHDVYNLYPKCIRSIGKVSIVYILIKPYGFIEEYNIILTLYFLFI